LNETSRHENPHYAYLARVVAIGGRGAPAENGFSAKIFEGLG
jgi:hypothetical protein